MPIHEDKNDLKNSVKFDIEKEEKLKIKTTTP